jgi:hypothetical protein
MSQQELQMNTETQEQKEPTEGHGEASDSFSELLCCPFCGGKGSETQKGDNYVIVRCENLACSVRPSATCYEKDGSYNFFPWNSRAI